jgi:hypothetical protein
MPLLRGYAGSDATDRQMPMSGRFAAIGCSATSSECRPTCYRAALAGNLFVLRTDVKSYYASIDHLLLMDMLARSVGERNTSLYEPSLVIPA